MTNPTENTRRVYCLPPTPFALFGGHVEVANGHRRVIVTTPSETFHLAPEDARRLAVILNDQAAAAEHDVAHEGSK